MHATMRRSEVWVRGVGEHVKRKQLPKKECGDVDPGETDHDFKGLILPVPVNVPALSHLPFSSTFTSKANLIQHVQSAMLSVDPAISH